MVACIPYLGAAPSLIGASDALITLPSRAARSFAKTHGLGMRPAPLEIDRFGYRLLWHERAVRDPASVWLRAVLAGG